MPFSDKRYLVFYVTLLYRGLRPGQAVSSTSPSVPCASWAEPAQQLPTAKLGHPQPCRELGDTAGKPHRADLNLIRMFTGRGVLGAGSTHVQVKWGAGKQGKFPPPDPSSGIGTVKKALTLAGLGSTSWGGSSKDIAVLAAGEQTLSPGRSQQVSVLHFNSSPLPAWTNHQSTSSLGS